MQKKAYRFGRCELRLASRELVVDGTVQFVEPLIFDLLVYLIAHRARVVSKNELLDQLWKNRFVTVGVIARTVYRARQAIRDSEKRGWIKTVTRVGYRFTGEVEEHSPVALTASARSRALAARIDAGADVGRPSAVTPSLLPIENRASRSDLDWIELGLMSMVAEALSSDLRLSLPSISSVLTAQSPLPQRATAHQREAVMRRLLDVQELLRVSVHHLGDHYVLDWSVESALNASHGYLRGPELTPLCQRMVQEVGAALFSLDLAPVPAANESMDPLANKALARALQAVAEQKYQVAINLFRVVLDMELLNTESRRETRRRTAIPMLSHRM
jgi:DNA-binding winged helix-turn-helix (wHTH) protein